MLFEQDGNCCDGGFELLEINVKDGGGGKFLVLKTAQWAATKEELIAMIDKVEKAFECDEATDGERS